MLKRYCHALQPHAQPMNIMITLSPHVAHAVAAFLSPIFLFTPPVERAVLADLAYPFPALFSTQRSNVVGLALAQGLA